MVDVAVPGMSAGGTSDSRQASSEQRWKISRGRASWRTGYRVDNQWTLAKRTSLRQITSIDLLRGVLRPLRGMSSSLTWCAPLGLPSARLGLWTRLASMPGLMGFAPCIVMNALNIAMQSPPPFAPRRILGCLELHPAGDRFPCWQVDQRSRSLPNKDPDSLRCRHLSTRWRG
jgi:hypothetical protein